MREAPWSAGNSALLAVLSSYHPMKVLCSLLKFSVLACALLAMPAFAAPVSKVLTKKLDIKVPAGKMLTIYNMGTTSNNTSADMRGWVFYVVKKEEFVPSWGGIYGSVYGPVTVRFKPGKDMMGETSKIYVLYEILPAKKP